MADAKFILNISDTPTWSKALPVVALGAGLALAKYQGKECVWCYVGYALTGLIVGSIPLVYKAKE